MASRRKFVIKPVATQNRYDASQITETWSKLRTAAESILAGANCETMSFEQLYRYSYHLVLHKHGKMLYDGIRDVIHKHLAGEVAPAVSDLPEEHILPALQERWSRHLVTSRMIADILMYLDRSFVAPHKMRPVLDMAVVEFREGVLHFKDVSERVTSVLLDMIARSRAGEATDKALIRNTLNMLVQLGVGSMSVYQKVFEDEFISSTDAFFRAESADFLAAHPCPEYLRKAEARIEGERQRLHDYLAHATGERLRRTVERRLVADHTATLVDMPTGAIAMMEAGRLEELETMYRLFAMVHTTVSYDVPVRIAGKASGTMTARELTPLDILKDKFERHLEAHGDALVSDAEEAKNPVRFVEQLLAMRAKYAEVVSRCFAGARPFKKAMKEAFENFVNVDTRCAEFLSLFLDVEMRQGFKTKSPGEVDETLSSAITLFRYIKDKDIFESFYKQHLQKRLLTNRSVNDDAEQSMLLKLKAECGPQFTSKMEGMFGDLRSSRQQMLRYRRDTGSSFGVQLDVTILTTVHWPNISETPCRLPSAIQPAADAFKHWYLSSHAGRRLEWATSQGTAEVGVLHTPRKYELVVSTYQACILELFNGPETVSFERIQSETAIPADELKRHLISLCTPVARVLIKHKKGKVIDPEDEFSVNAKYKSPKVRNRIKLVTLRSALGSKAATGAIPEQVEMARRNMIDAAIVRIMKARRTLSHPELVAETVRVLSHRFTPKPQQIKARIENLIDRDYVARSETDRKQYEYVA